MKRSEDKKKGRKENRKKILKRERRRLKIFI
jgi:hypothetical protein